MKNIEDLKQECERRLGRSVASPTEFNELSFKIQHSTGRNISVSTLKRIWGYVKYSYSPTFETLSILAAYAGYRDWLDFKNSASAEHSSDFIGDNIIKSSTLQPGILLRVCWNPNRNCLLKYLGDNRFKVIESSNAKLKVGDTFHCSVFAKGEAMMCYDVKRDDKLFSKVYVAGKSGGLTQAEVL